MHTRAQVFWPFFFSLVFFIFPSLVQASSPLYVAQVRIGDLPMISTLGYGMYQTTLKAGDANQQITINVQSWQGVPTISADLSQIGFLSPTTTPLSGGNNPYHFYINGADYYPDYFFKFWPLTIGADVPDGLKTISVIATDAVGNVATGSTKIIIDNVPPTISLTDISFSVVPPQKGDVMYLSGLSDGTGSVLTIYQIRETLWDALGNPIFGSSGGIDYGKNLLTTAIASSVDGSFTRVPFILNDSPSNALSIAASIKITITAYDGSGHVVTTSLVVPVPIPDGRIYYSGDLRATSSPYISQELRRLAKSSKTGKVTIVAHSNGGLMTKALIQKLVDTEAAKLIDKIIFIAVPQAGTPQAISAILHGYEQGLPKDWLSVFLSPETARTLTANMPSAYNLLPSANYFTYVDNPVVKFDDSDFLAAFRARYGSTIHDGAQLKNFIADA
ncbi:hypothetical protein HY972_02605 [Candidatus Kaiserbacteria bacterium]|nr:hypothetical protein [Candidatus Kaiserbacteria bacterium]